VVDTTIVFITTTSEASGLSISTKVPAYPLLLSLVGAIELSIEEKLLRSAITRLEMWIPYIPTICEYHSQFTMYMFFVNDFFPSHLLHISMCDATPLQLKPLNVIAI
jgi:hypothetical protein